MNNYINLNQEVLEELVKNSISFINEEGITDYKDYIFRSVTDYITDVFNEIMEIEMNEHLGYKKNEIKGNNSGNSRNGYYTRGYSTTYGKLELKVPRDRLGTFRTSVFELYKRSQEDLITAIIELYCTGSSNEEIKKFVLNNFGAELSPSGISNVIKVIDDSVKEFHNRKLATSYKVIFMDATYIKIRSKQVNSEAIHVIMGITEDGYVEVIDFDIFANEAADNYRDMLINLRRRGVQNVDLFVTDGLSGIVNACLDVFPSAKHQTCWVHIVRNILKLVKKKEEKGRITAELREIYTADSKEEAFDLLEQFIIRNKKQYKKIITIFTNVDPDSLFSFMEFPKQIHKAIYSTNIIENFNGKLKAHLGKKKQFPNHASAERFITVQILKRNRTSSKKRYFGFAQI